MGYELRLPKISGNNPLEQLGQIKSYLYQHVEQLQWVLNQIDANVTNSVGVVQTPNQPSADSVVGVGVRYVDLTNLGAGAWHYRVWKSGAFDLHGQFEISPICAGAIGSSGMYGSDTIQIELPFTVKDIQFSVMCDGLDLVGVNGVLADSKKEVAFKLISPNDFSTATTTTVRIVAGGTTY